MGMRYGSKTRYNKEISLQISPHICGIARNSINVIDYQCPGLLECLW